MTVNNANYGTADVSTLGQYKFNVIQQNQAYGIIGLRLSNFLSTITDGVIIAVSYSSTFTVAATNGIATSPDDAGNVIYRAVCTTAGYNEYIAVKSGAMYDNFFVEANRPIYIHQWASTNAIAAANMVAQGFLTLYTELTGIRT